MGHITRCLAVAVEAKSRQRQNDIFVLVEDRLDTFITSRDCIRVSYPQELTSLGPWEGWGNIDYVHASLGANLRILEEIQPDVVVHDRHPTLPIACELTGTPCTWLAQYCDNPSFFFSSSNSPFLFWARHTFACDEVLRKNGLQPTDGDWRSLFFRNPTIIPSIPEFERFPEGIMGGRVSYAGPLIFATNNHFSPIFERNPDILTIFVYGVVKTQQDIDQMIDCFENTPVHLVITALPKSIQIPKRLSSPMKISTYSFVNVSDLLPKCDVAIIHGGHGSCMTVLSMGVPAVVLLKSQEHEQEYNGKRLEEMGVARCTTWSTVKDNLHQEVRTVTQESIYCKNARKWQKVMQQWNGPKAVYDMLTTLSNK